MLIGLAALCASAVAGSAQGLPACLVETVAGGGVSLAGDGGPALEAELIRVRDTAAGPRNTVYLSDAGNRAIWRYYPDGHIELLPGAGTLDEPATLAVTDAGEVYFAAESGGLVYRMTEDGVVSHFAGNGGNEYSGDGGAATDAGIGHVAGIAVGPDGSVYLATPGHQRVRRVGADGRIETFAGSGPVDMGDFSGDGGPATSARLHRPSDVAVTADGRVFIADTNNFRIRIVSVGGMIDTVAGDGTPGVSIDGATAADSPVGLVDELDLGLEDVLFFSDERARGTFYLDGGGALRQYSRFTPSNSLSVTASGEAYANDSFRVLLINPDTNLGSPVAGIGTLGRYGDAGDGALDTPLIGLRELAVGSDGTLYLAESLGRRRTVSSAGVMDEQPGPGNPLAVAAGPDGQAYYAYPSSVDRVGPEGRIEIWAGERDTVRDMAVDSAGTVYLVVDSFFEGQVIMTVNDLVLSSIGADFDEFPGHVPTQIVVDAQDRLVVLLSSTTGRSIVRWAPSDGSTELLLNDSDVFRGIHSIAAGPGESVYIAETGTGAVWLLRGAGAIEPFIGADQLGPRPAGDGGPLSAATFASISLRAYSGAAQDFRDLYVIDGERVRRVHDAASCGDSETPSFTSSAVVNGASYTAPLAPGQIFSIFGQALGPVTPVTAQLVDGLLATELAGVRVLVNDVPAPLVFVAAGQLSAVMPFGTEVGPATVVVERGDERSSDGSVSIQATAPGLFTADASGQGQAAALNEDGSLNTAENPAAPGSVVVLYGTGEGATDPSGVDGKPGDVPLPRPVAPVRVLVNGAEAEVLYAGGAPGLTAGLLQVNVRMPADASGNATVVLEVGGVRSSPVTVTVAP